MLPMSVRNLAAGARVELRLHEHATAHQYRELGVFVRYCIDRIERDLERADWWTIKIVPNRVCYGCDVIAQYGDVVVEANGNGFDGAVAGWEAFSKIEGMLRENGMHREPDVEREVAVGGSWS